jgi:hypothetical protein
MFWSAIMLTFFNVSNIELASKGNPTRFLQLFKNHCKRKLPDPTIKYALHGTSYILHPEPLFIDNKIDILYKIQYIQLAARRDYGMYRLYKRKDLDLTMYPDLELQAVLSNPLLDITKLSIKFLYEEKEN